MFDIATFLIFAATCACVFGIASLFEKPRTAAVLSIRRGGASGWFGVFADKFKPSEKDKLTDAKWLLQAGFESLNAVEVYTAVRVVLAIVFPLVVLVLLPIVKSDATSQMTLLTALLAAIIGALGPKMFVGAKRSSRQQAVREALPTVLDLMLVSTEAGLGLDTSILRVGEELKTVHPIIASHLSRISTELRAGRQRVDCFRAFGNRCGIQETTTMVNLLVQSDALGTSMANTLRAYAEDMRAHRLLRAEEIGQKISVKLSGVLVLCFLPAIFLMIFTPVVIKLMAQFHH